MESIRSGSDPLGTLEGDFGCPCQFYDRLVGCARGLGCLVCWLRSPLRNAVVCMNVTEMVQSNAYCEGGWGYACDEGRDMNTNRQLNAAIVF
ncbi:hypothetical protein TNCV_1664181 [Trichonephila clavipes]|uniref:Uncharacterized protein n=1 Tax=Trichonephila clavipes TaxID=2585209 RepID=A0A8X6V5T4_TRICX|nr:hypothetical protein TNCV_1664181 [Trichonephila clavipes]